MYLGCFIQLEDSKQQGRGMSLEILRLKSANDTLEEKLDICKRDKRSLETDIKVCDLIFILHWLYIVCVFIIFCPW